MKHIWVYDYYYYYYYVLLLTTTTTTSTTYYYYIYYNCYYYYYYYYYRIDLTTSPLSSFSTASSHGAADRENPRQARLRAATNTASRPPSPPSSSLA